MLNQLPTLLVTSSMLALASLSAAAGPAEFEAPVRLMAGGDFVKVEAPGYAAPAFGDLDGDGRGDLVVGQFNKGKLKVYRGGPGGFVTGEWLQADGAAAEVPGVW